MPNRQVKLRKRPGIRLAPACFEIVDAPLVDPRAGQVLIRNIYLSCDPYMLSRMNGATAYAEAFAVGDVIPARVVGEVERSRDHDFQEGDFVWDFLGWEGYSMLDDTTTPRKIDPGLGPISHSISVLEMPGLWAVPAAIKSRSYRR